jgi:predicted transcriptional regulator
MAQALAMAEDLDRTASTILTSTVAIVAAYASHNAMSVTGLLGLIPDVHKAIIGLGADPELERPDPAVPIRQSVMADTVTCLHCGFRGKSLKRHIAGKHGQTPDEYRKFWGLKPDHPIVAPTYAARRSELAKASGLGKRGAP